MKKTRCPSHPGEILQGLYMEGLNITVTELAAKLGVTRQTLSRIINGKNGVTANIALRFSKAFPNTDAKYWLDLQQDYDLWQEENNNKDWRSIKAVA